MVIKYSYATERIEPAAAGRTEAIMAATDRLTARVQQEGNTVTLFFSQLLGDHPILDEDDESIYQYVVSDTLHHRLKAMERFGIQGLEYQDNHIRFTVLPGLDVLDAIARVVSIVAEHHEAVPFVILSSE